MLLGPYSSSGEHTFAFGAYAVLEALTHRPRAVRLVVHDGRLGEERLEALERACDLAGAPLQRDERAVGRLRHRSDVEVMAVVAKEDDALSPAADHALFVRPSQGGNLGTAIRSLLAFGIDEVALIAPQVDAWSPHVVRASVGLRFAVRCRAFPDEAAYLAVCGRRTLHLFDASAPDDLRDASFAPPLTLVFGPEGPQGTPILSASRAASDWMEPLRAAVEDASAASPDRAARTPLKLHRIALDPRAESLNLAAAVTVAAFQASRARGGRPGPA